MYLYLFTSMAWKFICTECSTGYILCNFSNQTCFNVRQGPREMIKTTGKAQGSIGKVQYKLRVGSSLGCIRKVRYAYYYMYVRKSSVLLAGTGVRKFSSVACGFSPVKIQSPEKFNQQNN